MAAKVSEGLFAAGGAERLAAAGTGARAPILGFEDEEALAALARAERHGDLPTGRVDGGMIGGWG
jgi:hypothetical protein